LSDAVELSSGAKSALIEIGGAKKPAINLQFEIIDGNRGTKRLGLATFGDMTLAAVRMQEIAIQFCLSVCLSVSLFASLLNFFVR
jgi:hypothetical protein